MLRLNRLPIEMLVRSPWQRFAYALLMGLFLFMMGSSFSFNLAWSAMVADDSGDPIASIESLSQSVEVPTVESHFPSTLDWTDLPELRLGDMTTTDASDTINADDEALSAGITHEAAIVLNDCDGKKRHCLKLDVTLLDYVASGYSLVGDNVEAVLSEDTMLDGQLLSKGTLFLGSVSRSSYINDKAIPKAILAITFSALRLPGQKTTIPLAAKWEKETSLLSVTGSAVGDVAKEGSKGLLSGTWASVTKGLGAALYSHGTSVLTSAAIGGMSGLYQGAVDHHSAIVLNSGDKIALYLDKPIAGTTPSLAMLTAVPSEVIQSENVSLAITDTQKEVDPFNIPNQLRLTFSVTNKLNQDISALNMAVIDATGRRYFVSPFKGTTAYKTVFPAKHVTKTTLTFTVLESDVTGYYLVVYNPEQPDEVLAKVPVSAS